MTSGGSGCGSGDPFRRRRSPAPPSATPPSSLRDPPTSPTPTFSPSTRRCTCTTAICPPAPAPTSLATPPPTRTRCSPRRGPPTSTRWRPAPPSGGVLRPPEEECASSHPRWPGLCGSRRGNTVEEKRDKAARTLLSQVRVCV